MVTQHNNLYNLLNELRIEQGMTITELCADIVSERSFIRYLKKEQFAVRTQVFTKLLKRLDLDFLQFMLYYTHYYQTDSGIYRFLGRVRFGHYRDIEPIYELILNYQSNNRIDELLVETYINFYEFDSGKIAEEKFKNRFLEIIAALPLKESDHLYTKHILLLYTTIYPQEPRLDINKLIKDTINDKSIINLFVKIMHLYTLVEYTLKYQTLAAEGLKELLDVFEYNSQLIGQKNNYALLNLGRAYYYYLKGETASFKEELWQSALNAIVIMDQHQFSKYQALVKQLFSFDIISFTNEYSTTGLAGLKELSGRAPHSK